MIDLAMIVQAGTSCCLATGLAAYVALLRRKSGPQWTLLAILVGIAAWTAGVVLAWSAPDSRRGVEMAIVVVFLGACFVPALAFHLAARSSKIAIFEEQPMATMGGVLVPGFLGFALLLTNPLHGLFLASPGFEIFAGSARHWAGPFFWIHLMISYSFTTAAMVVSGYRAVRAGPSVERRRLVLLALSSLVPLTANAAYVFGLLPIAVPLTYAGLGVTGLLLVVAIARYGLIESVVPARNVIAHLRAGILLADADGRVVSANRSAEELLGRSAALLSGRTLVEAVGALDPDGALRGPLTNPAEGPPVVVTIETPGGRAIEAHAGSLGPGRSAGAGRFLVLDDHTEQRFYARCRHRMERLDAINALVAGLSHEINNPLAFVQANMSHILRTARAFGRRRTHTADETSADLSDIGDAAEEAQAGLQRIHEIIASTRQLLGDPQAHRECIDLNEAVRQAVEASGLKRDGAPSLALRLHGVALGIRGSAVQLRQLVLNLLSNARDAVVGLRDALVLVETQRCRACDRCPGGAELRIGDSGRGVPQELRTRIFAPFFTTKEPGEGTGLGLAVCAEIVRNHRGVIDVSDAALGGACFRVRLPPADQECGPA